MSSQNGQDAVDLVVRTIAQTAVDEEKQFGDLDSVVGDGDLGYSLARGFEKLLGGWDDLDRTDIGTFLKKSGMIVTSRIGGTSGPLWGTAFMKAGMEAGTATSLTGDQVVAMLRAAIEGIKMRGQSDVGDKTLLDVLVPMTDDIEKNVAAGAGAEAVLASAAAVAKESAEATKGMVAKRGRASYTGDRSKDSVDAGATAVAIIVGRVHQAWKAEEPS